MELTDEFKWFMWLPIKITWAMARRRDLKECWTHMTNSQLIQWCIEHLETLGFKEADRRVKQACEEHGKEVVVEFLSNEIVIA